MAEPIPVHIPQENVNDESVLLVAWHVAAGAQVQAGQELADVEGSKAVLTIEAPVAGTVQYTCEVGQEIAVGAVLCTISQVAPAMVPQEPAVQESAVQEPAVAPSLTSPESLEATPEPVPAVLVLEASSSPPRFSQQATILLQQHGLDPQRFAGRALVRSADVLALLGQAPEAPGLASPSLEPTRNQPAGAPRPAVGVPFQTHRLSRQKQVEIRALAAGVQHTMSSVVTVAVPTRGLRAAAAQCAPAAGSATAIVLFEVARLLRHYPLFNGFYADGAAHLYDAINIGFALDAEHGLKVPVIRQADHKSLPEIATEMHGLLRRYLDDTLQVEDLAAGTFTITDLGASGVFTFHPLITQGQAAILGMGGEWGGGGPAGTGFFNLMLAFDHQLTAGRQAATFLQDLAQRLQAYEAALGGPQPVTAAPHCARCLTSLSRLRQLDQGQGGGYCLVPAVQPDGTQAYYCNLCLQGW